MIASVLIRINILKRFLNYKFKISSLFSIFIRNIRQKHQFDKSTSSTQTTRTTIHTILHKCRATAMTKTHTNTERPSATIPNKSPLHQQQDEGKNYF